MTQSLTCSTVFSRPYASISPVVCLIFITPVALNYNLKVSNAFFFLVLVFCLLSKSGEYLYLRCGHIGKYLTAKSGNKTINETENVCNLKHK